MDGVGLCLFLPRRTHFSCPTPSFVEAVTGVPSETPARDAIVAATALLHRLTAAGAVLPLNLFGAAGGSVSDQPDFLVTREALPYVFSLIGGRNWKSGPGAKASPLTLEIWKQLDGAGAQTAAEIQTVLGREVTEGAILRGLVELWNGLRAIPVYDGDVTRWELTQARFADEMTASQKVAQTTALSALVAGYLESAIAASSEEIETFLSPLTSRSRVREVVNGLSATRQLGLVSVAATPLLHVAGTLPEFAEPVEVELPARTAGLEREGRSGSFERKPRTGTFERKPRTTRDGGAARKPYERGGRPAERGGERRGRFDRGRSGPPRERTGFGRADSGRFAARGDAPFRPKAAGERPYRSAEGGRPLNGERKPFERKPFGKKPFDKGAKPFRAPSSGGARPFDRERSGSGAARPSFGAGARAGGGKFGPRKFGAGAGAKPWQDRGAGPRAGGRQERPAAGGEGERPFRPRSDGERSGERRPGKFGGAGKFGDEKKFGGPRKFGAGKSFGGPKFGARSGSGPRTGSRPAGSGPAGPRSFGSRAGAPRGGPPRTGSPRTARPGGSGRPSFSGGFKREAPGEKRPFFRERPAKAADGESRPRTFRSDAGPAKRTGGWKPKPAGGGFAKGGKPGFKSAGFKSAGFKSGGKPGFKSGGKAAFGKTGSGRPAKPFGKSGKPAFGGSKPGGFKPPFRKRKDEGGKSAE